MCHEYLGNISIIGIAGNTSGGSNIGVYDSGGSITNSSAIVITGTGNGSGGSGVGVQFDTGDVVQSLGAGNITITGTGSTRDTTGSDFGVYESGNGGTTNITSASGNITITGNGGGTGAGVRNYGVYLQPDGVGILLVLRVPLGKFPLPEMGEAEV